MLYFKYYFILLMYKIELLKFMSDEEKFCIVERKSVIKKINFKSSYKFFSGFYVIFLVLYIRFFVCLFLLGNKLYNDIF